MTDNAEKINRMLRSANEFLEISINNKTYIPNFVNMAFACELYLKIILQYKNREYCKGHDLKTLYDEVVKTVDENELLIILAEEISKNLSFDFCKNNIINAECNLQNMFSEHSNLFVEWRYIFDKPIPESGYIVDMTLCSFAKALKKYVETMIEVVP